MIAATMVVATIPVTDLERAKQFYGDVLALTLLSETPAGARYRCGDVSEISIFKRPPSPRSTPRPLRGRRHRGRSPGPRAKGVEFLDYSEGPLTTTGHIAQVGPARGAGSTIPTGTPSAFDRHNFATGQRGTAERPRRLRRRACRFEPVPGRPHFSVAAAVRPTTDGTIVLPSKPGAVYCLTANGSPHSPHRTGSGARCQPACEPASMVSLSGRKRDSVPCRPDEVWTRENCGRCARGVAPSPVGALPCLGRAPATGIDLAAPADP